MDDEPNIIKLVPPPHVRVAESILIEPEKDRAEVTSANQRVAQTKMALVDLDFQMERLQEQRRSVMGAIQVATGDFHTTLKAVARRNGANVDKPGQTWNFDLVTWTLTRTE